MSRDRKMILLVEDHPYFTEVAREALGPDYHTVSVGTKDEALKVIQTEPPALMILDLSLASGQDGRDLLREIPNKQFPILIFTAQDETTLYGDPWEELKALGADGIVLKTINVGEELKRKVGDLLDPE
jgi:CheY-like chemotaxis protein